MNVEIKTVEVKDAGDGEGNGEFEVILSAPTLDRDGEIIDKGAFDPLPADIAIHVDHDMTTRGIVGRARPFYDGDVLKASGFYASTPRAQEIRTLVREQVVRTMSVGFMSAERTDKDGVPHITSGELLEASFVSVPSNREALVLAAKAAVAKVGARNSTEDTARLQAIHDLSVENGADCESKAATPDQQKTARGNDHSDHVHSHWTYPLLGCTCDEKSPDTDPEQSAADAAAAEPAAADAADPAPDDVDRVKATAARTRALLAQSAAL